MKKNPSVTKNINFESFENKELTFQKNITETKFKVIAQYDKNGPNAQNDRKAEDLFSSFTANIIKEETLFIR